MAVIEGRQRDPKLQQQASGDPRAESQSGESGEQQAASATSFKLSKRRWAILAAISIFGFLNGLVNEQDSILATLIALLEIPLDKYVYIGIGYRYVVPFLGMHTARLVDRFGLKAAIQCAVPLAALRNGARAMLFAPRSPHWRKLRYFYWISGSLTSLQIVIIYYCLPLKVSESWFPKEERSLAWSCLVLSPTLGSAIASLLLPKFAKGVNSVEPLAYLNLASFALTALALLIGVTHSKPKEAPSERSLKSANLNQTGALESLKLIISNRNLLIQMFTITSFNASAQSIRGVLQDVLAVGGISQVACGYLLATMSFGSILIQLTSSLIGTDRTGHKGNTYICKLYLSMLWLSFIFYMWSLNMQFLAERQLYVVMGAAIGFTVCSCWSAPHYNNVCAHLIAGSISEASISAANTIASILLGSLYSGVFVYLRTDPETGKKADYSHSILFLTAIASLVTLLYLTCFSSRRPEDRIARVAPQPQLQVQVQVQLAPATTQQITTVTAQVTAAHKQAPASCH